MDTNEKYINRCLELAQCGLPSTMPNPSVGAVIVVDNNIIGEGYTSAYGGSHAEVNAINAVDYKSILTKATLFVSLEPCSHFGKTPPCADLIIKHQIPNVVVGIVDPYAKVAGAGIKKLIDAGINVTVGVLEKECLEMNKRFFTFHQKQRPYIILKWAETQDGFIAPEVRQEHKPVWISNEFSRQLVHKWRSEEQAILVGTKTVIDDNPRLDTRDWFGKNPLKIIIDKNNRISKENHIFDNQSENLILSDETIDFSSPIASQIATYLYKKNIQSVIIEGGKQTLQTFIDANVWDEARVFKSSILFENGIKAPELNLKNYKKTNIFCDELLIYRNND